MKKALEKFDHIFVQDEGSKKLLETIHIKCVSVSGDTRFDRVSEILEQDNFLDFMNQFKQDNICFVAGSTWPEDDEVIVDYINASKNQLKYVIAPHNIKKGAITALHKSIAKKTELYSKIDNQNLSDFDVLIIDTVGLLTKIYSYANIAYVGGGFATGLHNILEPAVFGIPVLIGPKYKGFKEAEELVNQKGTLTINDKIEFQNTLDKLVSIPEFYKITGRINSEYISNHLGATTKIMAHLRNLL